MELKRWSGAAIATTVALQLVGIWLLLSSREPLGARGTGLLIVLGVVLALTTALYIRKQPGNRSVPGDARRANDRLRLAMESGKAVAWDWDVRTGRDVWSGDLKTLFGMSGDTYEGHVEDFRRRLHPDDREHVWTAVAMARRNRTPYRTKFRVVWPDGTVRRASATGKFYFAANGEATRMLGIAADITELTGAADGLSDSRERQKGIVDAARDAIIAVDDDQRVQVFNTAAEKMFGCLAFDAIGAPLERFLPARVRAVHREHVHRLGDAGVTSQAMAGLRQLRALRSDGNEFPIEASISQSDVDGETLSTMILRDVTERMREDEALRERFRLMSDTAPAMLWTSAPDKLCDYFNRSWLEFTGRPLESEIGDGWKEGVHPEDLKQCIDTYGRAFERREQFRMEYRLRRYDGEYRWILDTGVPRLNADGAFSGYIGSAVDVTELRMAERALSGLSQRLMEAQERERAWIARQLHDDVAQRMALLTIELDQLNEVLPQAAADLRKRIRKLRGRALDLCRDIGNISHRVHSSKLEYLGIASAASAFCRELSEQKSVAISFSHEGVPEHVPKEVALALFRVLQEALTNAVTHAGVNHFSVALHGGGDGIQLEVVDTGIGFDPQATLRRHGLGLVSMQERLSLVHGEIAIDSRPGAGTQVRARVPLGVFEELADGGLDEVSPR